VSLKVLTSTVDSFEGLTERGYPYNLTHMAVEGFSFSIGYLTESLTSFQLLARGCPHFLISTLGSSQQGCH
jgi:hypothetical protein